MTNELDTHYNLNLVLFGGGGGGSVMASGFVDAFPDASISVVVPMGDSGSSTGVIREVFGGPAVGDLGKVLCAVGSSAVVSRIFDQRFDELATPDDVARLNEKLLSALPDGATANRASPILDYSASLCSELPGLYGHTYRNLVLTALRLHHGDDILSAAEEFSTWVSARANVLPVTPEAHDVVLTDRSNNGHRIIRGEGIIDDYPVAEVDKADIRLDLGPGRRRPYASKQACFAISHADIAVIGPGSPLTSIAPSITADGIPEAFAKQKENGGIVVSIANLFAEPQATPRLTLDQLIRFIGRHAVTPGYVVYNTRTDALPEGRVPLACDHIVLRSIGASAIGADLVAPHVVRAADNDPIAALRSDMHHDPRKVAEVLKSHVLSS